MAKDKGPEAPLTPKVKAVTFDEGVLLPADPVTPMTGPEVAQYQDDLSAMAKLVMEEWHAAGRACDEAVIGEARRRLAAK